MVKVVIAVYFLVFALLVCRRPGYALPAWFVCALGLEQWAIAKDAFFGAHSALLNYACGILIVFAIGVAISRGDRPFTYRYSWPLLALYGLSYLSYMWCINRPAAALVFNHSAPYVFTFVILLPLTLNSFEDVQRAWLGLLVAGAIVSFVLLNLEQTGYRAIEYAQGAVDRYGQFESGGNPLAVGELGGAVAFIAAMYRVRGMSRWAMLILRWGLVAIGLAAVFRSGSRGQLLATVMVLPVFVMAASPKISPKYVLYTIFGLALCAAIGIWATSFIPEQTLARWTTEKMFDDYGHRTIMCQQLITAWSGGSVFHWLFGLGAAASWEVVGYYPHVIPVEILGEYGLFGFSLYILVLIETVRAWMFLYRSTKDDATQRSTIAILGTFVVFNFLLSLKQGAFTGGYMTFLWPLLLIRLKSIAQHGKRRAKVASRLTSLAPNMVPA